MKQIFKTNFGYRTEDIPIPTPGSNEILVQVSYSLISTGTETSGLRKKAENDFQDILKEKKEQFRKVKSKLEQEGLKPTIYKIKKKIFPSESDLIFSPIGYSNSGVVLEVGAKVKDFNPGDEVACAGSGIASHAEYVTIPINLAVKIPESLSMDKAAFTTVASIALQGIRRANLQPGENVVIYGLGLLGLIAVQMAKAYGYRVFGVDILRERADLALILGADKVSSSPETMNEKIKAFTNDQGADAVIVYAASSANTIINNAIELSRRKGRVVLVGAVGMNVQREAMYKKEVDLIMSTSYGPGRYDDNYEKKGNDYPFAYVRWTENRNMQEVVRLLHEDKLRVSELINKVFSVTQAEEAFHSLVNKENNYIGVLFKYEHKLSSQQNLNKTYKLEQKPINHDKINVALIGAGGFANRTHIPNIIKLGDFFRLYAIVDKDPIKAKSVGKKHHAIYSSTDYLDVLNDDAIDMVVVTSRHDSHARIVIDALKRNKHVLVEKPLAINRDELEELKGCLDKSQSLMRVGFNRRYSSLIKKVLEIIEDENKPVFINYRVNAGYIPADHWTQDPLVGGGRIIGEFCHFIDLVNYLISSPVKQFNAISIPVDKISVFSEDNISVQVSYQNGSMAQISYIANGDKGLPKERLEIFVGNKTMVVDDFKTLEMFNTGFKSIHLPTTDKGHFKELELFAKQLKNADSKILPPVDHDVFSTELVFDILKDIRKVY